MASPTTNKGYTYPAHNGSINTWDTPIDADFDQIDLNVGGTYNIVGTSTTAAVTFAASVCTAASTANLVTFPTSIAQNLYYKVTGAFTSSCVLVFPAVGSFYVINSALSSGALYAGISGNTANGTAISTNNAVLVVADSSNMFNTDPAAAATFAAGTGIIFAMASPPSGWTADYSLGGSALILSTAVGVNATTGGSWTISGLTIGSHTLTTSEIASHNHSYTKTNSDNSGYTNGAKNANDGTGSDTTGNTGGGGSHSHTISADATWRPAYYRPFRATKN